MQIKVFHPYFESSIFCKEILKKFPNHNIKIYQNNDFDLIYESEQLELHNELIFIMPLWWYSFPYNFVKWCQILKDNPNLLKDKRIKLIVMAGGKQDRYVEGSRTSIKNMNKWVDDLFSTIEWKIFYNCIPKNIDDLRAVWFKEWSFKGDKND